MIFFCGTVLIKKVSIMSRSTLFTTGSFVCLNVLSLLTHSTDILFEKCPHRCCSVQLTLY